MGEADAQGFGVLGCLSCIALALAIQFAQSQG